MKLQTPFSIPKPAMADLDRARASKNYKKVKKVNN